MEIHKCKHIHKLAYKHTYKLKHMHIQSYIDIYYSNQKTHMDPHIHTKHIQKQTKTHTNTDTNKSKYTHT